MYWFLVFIERSYVNEEMNLANFQNLVILFITETWLLGPISGKELYLEMFEL